MGTYSDFTRSHSKPKVHPRRIYWTHGAEPKLAHRVAEKVTSLVGPSRINTHRLSGTDPEAQILEKVNGHPLDPKTRQLIVLTRAQDLTAPTRKGILDWFADPQAAQYRHTVLLVHSDEAQPPDDVVAALRGKSTAQTIQCSLPKDPRARQTRALEALGEVSPLGPRALGQLWRHTHGDLTACFAFLEKLALLVPTGQVPSITQQTLDALAPSNPDHALVEHLLAGKKREAAQSLVTAPPHDPAQVLTTLAAEIWRANLLHPYIVEKVPVRDIVGRTGLTHVQVTALSPHVGQHAYRHTVRRSRLIAELLPHANTATALPMLVAAW